MKTKKKREKKNKIKGTNSFKNTKQISVSSVN